MKVTVEIELEHQSGREYDNESVEEALLEQLTRDLNGSLFNINHWPGTNRWGLYRVKRVWPK